MGLHQYDWMVATVSYNTDKDCSIDDMFDIETGSVGFQFLGKKDLLNCNKNLNCICQYFLFFFTTWLVLTY
jgi:hypothetical protein